MNTKLLAYSEIRTKIDTLATTLAGYTSLFALNGLVHEIACESLLHCREHGDVSLCKSLYDTCYGDGKNMVQADAVKYWFAKFGPLTARQGNWRLRENWTKEMFLIEEAEKTPILEFAPETEKRVITWSVGNVLTRLDGFLDKTRNAFQENMDGKRHFVGDIDKSEAALNDVITYARKRFAQENPADLGLLSNDEQNVFQQPKAPEKKADEAGDGDKLPESAPESRLIREGHEVTGDEIQPEAQAG